MEILEHWLETGQLSEDDLSVHYTNFFKHRQAEDDKYDNDCSSTSIGFDGSLPIFGLDSEKIVVMSHNCPMVLETQFAPQKTRAFNGYSHQNCILSAKLSPDGQYLASKSSDAIALWKMDTRSYLTHFDEDCLDFCWINNALISTLSPNFEEETSNTIQFWNWNGQNIESDGSMLISSEEQRILPNYASTQSNKSQIIAFASGSSSLALVSKIQVDHEGIDIIKFGHIHDVATNQIKHLIVLTTKSYALIYDTSHGCQLLKSHPLNTVSFRFLLETSRMYLLADSRGGVNFYDKSFKPLEKIKVSTHKIMAAIVHRVRTDWPCAEEKEILLSDEKSRIFKKITDSSDAPKLVYDGSVYQEICVGDCHPLGTVFSAGNLSGKLLHFDTKTCDLLEEISLGQGQIQALKYSPKGTFLGLGTGSGNIFYWPALEGDSNEPIKCSAKPIKHLLFNSSETLLAFCDESQIIGILHGGPEWELKVRIKVHSKPMTGLTFNDSNDLYTIGQDRKLCHIESHLLKQRKTIDKSSDPLLISYFQDFLVIGTENQQIRFVNPQTLLVRRIISIQGLPKAILIPKYGHLTIISEGGISIFSPDWRVSVDYWNIGQQGALQMANSCVISDIGQAKMKVLLTTSKMIMSRDIDRPNERHLIKYIKDKESAIIAKWKQQVSRLFKALNSINGCSRVEIQLSDLELILNGLGYFPTREQLEELAFEVRFRDSHYTWEVHETISINDFCLIMENYSNWLHETSLIEETESYSLEKFVLKSVETMQCFDKFLDKRSSTAEDTEL